MRSKGGNDNAAETEAEFLFNNEWAPVKTPDQEVLQDLLCRDAILTTIQLSLYVQERFTVEPLIGVSIRT
jgi:hypothetical protein